MHTIWKLQDAKSWIDLHVQIMPNLTIGSKVRRRKRHAETLNCNRISMPKNQVLFYHYETIVIKNMLA